MSDIIRALAAIKGQQEYHKYDKDKIDKEGIVLTNRNAEAAIMALEKQLPKKVYHFLDDDTFETTCCGLDVTNTDYDYCPECGCLLGEVEEVRMRMNKQEIEKALGFINDLMSDNTDDLLFDSEIGETIKSALQQQLTGGWIPVTERIPEECGKSYLLTVQNSFRQRKCIVGFTGYMENGKQAFYTNDKETDMSIWETIAWQMRPEPWKGEADETT